MLELKKISTQFTVGKHLVNAVNDVSIHVPNGKTIGLVGESGSGKSVTALSALQLLSDNATCTGDIIWKGRSLMGLSASEMRRIRGKEIAMIFQNPLAALNPVFTIGNQMVETILQHRNLSKNDALDHAISLLRRVNIPDPETRVHDYPHQFSIGMCQRIMIALTLSMQPDLVIADEPTASLDVTVQAQIMALLNELQTELGMSMLFISHDLGLIAQNCSYIYIMYLGRIVEEGSPMQIFKTPQHPYTQALIAAIPNPDPSQTDLAPPLSGDIPSPIHLPNGCAFHTRCPKADARCKIERPELQEVSDRKTACFFPAN